MKEPDSTAGWAAPTPSIVDNTGGVAVRRDDKIVIGNLLLDIQPSVLACQGAVAPSVLPVEPTT